ELREAKERLESSRTDRAFLTMLHKVQNYNDWLRTGRQLALPVVSLLFLVVAISTVIAGLMRKFTQAIPLYLASAACGVIACVVFLNHVENQRLAADKFALVTPAPVEATMEPMAPAPEAAALDFGMAVDALGEFPPADGAPEALMLGRGKDQ